MSVAELHRKDLHGYQNRTVDLMLEHDRFGLFLDMGLGKTVSALTAFNDMKYDYLAVESALVISTVKIIENVWPDEVEKWSHLEHLKVTPVVGTPAKRLALMNTYADIYAISSSMVEWFAANSSSYKVPEVLILDESSEFKGYSSNRFKALKSILPMFKKVYILTGTPAGNGLLDLWSQIFLLDGGVRLGRNITTYKRMHFCVTSRAKYAKEEIRGESSEKAIHEAIKDITVSMKAEDYLDMPELITNDIEIKLDTKTRAKYDYFVKQKVLEFIETGEEITAVNAGVLMGKLLQVCNGQVYDKERNVIDIHDLKLEALDEIIAHSAGKPILLAYPYQSNVAKILDRYKGKVKVRKLEKPSDMKDWNAGKIELGLLHPKSGGHGLNLQKGGHLIVWYGLHYSLELYNQLVTRIFRQGQESDHVIVNRLLIKNSADSKVRLALIRKERVQASLLDAVKDENDYTIVSAVKELINEYK